MYADPFFLYSFLLLAPGLLTFRFFRGRPSWWVIIPSAILGGWVLWLLIVVSHFDNLWALVDAQDDPDPDLVARATADGAPMVFAVFGGWFWALCYALPWWIIYGVANKIRRVRAG